MMPYVHASGNLCGCMRNFKQDCMYLHQIAAARSYLSVLFAQTFEFSFETAIESLSRPRISDPSWKDTENSGEVRHGTGSSTRISKG